MARKNNNVLTEAFLIDMYKIATKSEYILSIISEHIKEEDLPDKDFQLIHKCMCDYFREHKKGPTHGIMCQKLARHRGAGELWDEIQENKGNADVNGLVDQIEDYICQVRFNKAYKDMGEQYNSHNSDKALKTLHDYANWHSGFSLKSPEFINVVESFNTRHHSNKQNNESKNKLSPITRFHIDDLDAMNNGRDLRTQLTCFLAPTGVGKSHAARWIGKNACQVDGLNALHFQLEGSEDEVVNAYSSSLVACDSYKYETGRLSDRELVSLEKSLEGISGKLFVKSYPKFNCQVSTLDIRNGIAEFKKTYGINPDVVIIDSMDLLTDASGKRWSENGERHKRIAVANDLKDLAADEKVWMVVTYQATIENREWLNDEKNVLTEYNCAEAKGLARPMTHLITLNQSDKERKEKVMRLYFAKSRFFAKGDPIKIATEYDTEQFYCRQRTLNISKVNGVII